MSLPEIAQSALNDESVVAQVSLGGEDVLLVTPTRTVIYRAEGLLSDETVVEYPHDAERIDVNEGRRKAKVTLDYGLDGEETFALPTNRLDDALHPVLAGVLNAAGITDAGETVKQTFRFSELTVVVTSARLVKHIGSAVWDGEYEEYHYDDVTDLAFEEGSVATSVVVTLGERQERFKAPSEDARAVREALTSSLLAYYDVGSVEAFREAVASDDDESPERGADSDVAFGDGPAPLGADPPSPDELPSNSTGDADAESTAGAVTETVERPAQFDESEFESPGIEEADGADEPGDVAAELAALREAIEAQNERLRRQEELVDQLIEELRQGR